MGASVTKAAEQIRDAREAALGEFRMWEGHDEDPGFEDALWSYLEALDDVKEATEEGSETEAAVDRAAARIHEARDAIAEAWADLQQAIEEAEETISEVSLELEMELPEGADEVE